ncbi:shikimate dehydrogenase [Knoellia aerolata DSM 18566]|uniref:Shikimate dehydrogenase n=1 Tax=Knoellia aerolata DSM 18566 TaxID=1385519 RepID=A0A0A0JZG9_9MICO|nr:shikimate dehydrogenase [Knoellia aerolata]KGN42543.1 shikimate dehydrogenase [Knoellia aerolata DSM 18566]
MRAAVLGSPVAHSLSPLLHTTAYAALGLTDWTYTRREVTADELAGVVAGLDESWRGLSLTMPLKEAAFDVAATVSDVARDAGAVNTLVRRTDGGWDGHNTDVAGLAGALDAALDAALAVDGHDDRATLLGSGATSRSAALALVDLGVREVRVAARNTEAAAAVVALFESHGVAAGHVPLEHWVREPGRLVVSTLPPSASTAVGALLEHDRTDLGGVTLLDVVYAEWPTPLARAAQAHGADVVSGLEMLVRQAALQVELFTGRAAPLEAMAEAARREVGA